jgi:hypothetical protein
MDDAGIIRAAWGGCGNLFRHLLLSDRHFEVIMSYYQSVTTTTTWTNQEWNIRSYLKEYPVVHNSTTATFNLAWDNSLDAAFHYLVKNPTINHLGGTMIERARSVIHECSLQEHQIRLAPYISINQLLTNFDYLLHVLEPHVLRLDPAQVRKILSIWREKTIQVFVTNQPQIDGWFEQIGLDYSSNNLYTLIHENTNT